MDNENKNIFTPSSAASLDRLRERRNTASTGDDTGGEAVSAAQSGPENGQSRIPKILRPEARAARLYIRSYRSGAARMRKMPQRLQPIYRLHRIRSRVRVPAERETTDH